MRFRVRDKGFAISQNLGSQTLFRFTPTRRGYAQGVLGPALKRPHPSHDERDWGEGGGGGIDSALLRPCLMRYAQVIIFRHGRNLQSNPVAAGKGFSTHALKRQHPNPDERGWGVGGGGGIRTHGTLRLSSFQDWRNRPLYHPSVRENQVSRCGYALVAERDQGNFRDGNEWALPIRCQTLALSELK